ncbi:MAG: recombinase family protein [archaeon]|nr:recombinase family protein [archaeon]
MEQELKKEIRVALYLRCSTIEQELVLQLEALTKRVNRMKEDNPHITYIVTEYKDKGFSGKNKERPEFQKLMKDIEMKKIDCILITRLDRLSRSLQDLLNTTSTLKNNNCNLIVVEQNIDTSDAQGTLLFQIIGAFAEFERTLITERMTSGRKRAEQMGVICNRPKKSIDSDGIAYKFKSGWSMNQISKAYNVSITPIRRILRERGLR